MSVLEFIEHCHTGLNADWIMMCGPSCVGKSHFMNTHGLYFAKKAIGGKNIYIPLRDKHFKHLGIHHHWALTSDPNEWPEDWLELYNTKNFTINKKAIVIGIPYSIWLKRGEMRGFCPRESARLTSVETFVQSYKKIFKKLKNNKIPHISVDSRDDYPILDELSFIKMLKE